MQSLSWQVGLVSPWQFCGVSLPLPGPSRACPGAPDLARLPLPALHHVPASARRCLSLALRLSRPTLWPKHYLMPKPSSSCQPGLFGGGGAN